MSYRRLHPYLPVFGVEDGVVSAVYIPGYVMPASRDEIRRFHAIWAGNALPVERQLSDLAGKLASAAAEVEASWHRMHRKEFTPVCLNIMLPYSCSLACDYCYSRPENAGEPGALNRAAATAAARMVSANCARLGAPFQVDIQGEGEPSCRWDDLLWCVEMTQSIAENMRIEWSAHLTTNGQIDIAQAERIGRTFTHVTLSCDGPPDIQDVCRPCRNGGPSSLRLEASAAKLASMMEALDARVTVTAANIRRLDDVIRYISRRLGIRSIRLEPAFSPARAEDAEPDPRLAAELCLNACDAGRQHGAEVTLGSPRLTELHGAYCQAQRGILRIMPDGAASNCMRGVGRDLPYAAAIGRHDAVAGTYSLDMDAIDRLRLSVEKIPEFCRNCINAFHCCRNCPDQCNTDGLSTKSWRCRFQEAAAKRWILAMAGQAREIPQPVKFRRQIESEARDISDPLVREEIIVNTQLAAEWRPLDRAQMPAPVWEDERYRRRVSECEDDILAAAAAGDGNISVYVHLPFCRARCVFCDCHSVSASRGHDERFAAYIERLGRDLDVWRERGRIGRRPVSTIHFGGGTPLAIGEDRFSELTDLLRGGLNVSVRTQWAIETTAACATSEHIGKLMSLGFRRLHVGVQTLDGALRRKLGRISGSSEVVERLCAAMKAGMTTSVDLIYGLPGQTVGMLLEDVSILADAGIHGFSLYRLNLTQRNHQKMWSVFPGFHPSPLRSCVMLQAAESLLLLRKYEKNHYVHYALPSDDNLYYRHAARGEDMVGLGASAAGAIGEWEYRCAFYPRYMDNTGTALPIESLAFQHLKARERMVVTGLMAGRIPAASLPVLGAGERLVESWVRYGLLAGDEDGLRLTATGAWMLGNMLEEFIPANGNIFRTHPVFLS